MITLNISGASQATYAALISLYLRNVLLCGILCAAITLELHLIWREKRRLRKLLFELYYVQIVMFRHGDLFKHLCSCVTVQ